MTDKIVLRNPQKFDVGIVTSPERPLGVNIRPGSFALVTQDELAYLASTSTLLSKGILRVDEKQAEAMQEIGIDQASDPNFITDEEIKKKLGGTAKKVREWLNTIEEGYILDRIYDAAMGMNLSQDKLKALQEKMPDKAFLEN